MLRMIMGSSLAFSMKTVPLLVGLEAITSKTYPGYVINKFLQEVTSLFVSSSNLSNFDSDYLKENYNTKIESLFQKYALAENVDALQKANQKAQHVITKVGDNIKQTMSNGEDIMVSLKEIKGRCGECQQKGRRIFYQCSRFKQRNKKEHGV